MGAKRDAGLSVLVLAVVGVAFVVVDASPSIVAAVAGGLGTLGFELVAARDPETVRDYWERPLVQWGCVALALAGIVVGAWLAPSSVLSFALGSLLAYLGFLGVVVLGRRLDGSDSSH